LFSYENVIFNPLAEYKSKSEAKIKEVSESDKKPKPNSGPTRRQYTYKVTLGRIRATIIAVKKQ